MGFTIVKLIESQVVSDLVVVVLVLAIWNLEIIVLSLVIGRLGIRLAISVSCNTPVYTSTTTLVF